MNFIKNLGWNSNTNQEGEAIQLKAGTSSNDGISLNNKSCLDKLKNFFVSKIQVETSYLRFGIIFFTGIAIIIISFLFLPLIIITPKKFTLLFALGTFVSISSFLFYFGTNKFFDVLFNKDRIWFTIAYLTGFLGCLFFPAFFGKNYILILVFSGLEMISTLFFILTFIPGGYSSIRMFTNIFFSQFKRLFNR